MDRPFSASAGDSVSLNRLHRANWPVVLVLVDFEKEEDLSGSGPNKQLANYNQLWLGV